MNILDFISPWKNTYSAVPFYRTQFGPFLRSKPNMISEPFYQEILQLSKPFISEETIVIDVGCALGRLTFEYAKMGAKNVTGLDISPYHIVEADAIGRKLRDSVLDFPLQGVYEFFVADCSNLDYKSNSIDFISCINVVDRMKNPKKAVRELFRILKPGGILLIADPYDWDTRYTSKANQVTSLHDLFHEDSWHKIGEYDDIEYDTQVHDRLIARYSCHVMTVQKHQ